MPLDELLINTGVDGLIKLVHKRGRVEMGEAARILRLSPQTLEDWAHVLEDEGVIKLDYQLTKVYLAWITGTREEISDKVEELQIKRNAAQEEIETRIAVAEAKGAELENMAAQYREVYRNIEPRIAKIADKMAGLKKFERDKNAVFAGHREKLEDSKKKLEQLDAAISESEDSIREIGLKAAKSVAGRRIDKKDLEELREYQQKIRDRSGTIARKYEKIVEQAQEQKDALSLVAKSGEALQSAKADFATLGEMKRRLEAELAAMPAREKEIGEKVAELSKANERFKDADRNALELRAKVDALKRDADALNERTVSLSQGIREQAGLLSSLSRQIEIAKDVRLKLDSMSATRQSIASQIGAIEEKQAAVDSNITRLGKLFADIEKSKQSVGEVKGLLLELESMRKQAEGERQDVLLKANELLAIIDEQIAKFGVLEDAKSKTAMSIAAYMKELEKVKAEYVREKAGFDRDIASTGTELAAYKREIDADIAGVKAASGKLDEALAKKEEVDRVLERINSLKEEQGKLVQQLKLLAKEVQVLELKEEPTGWEPKEEKVVSDKLERIKEKIDTARDDEAEFDRKRKELRGLIEKMWSEESK